MLTSPLVLSPQVCPVRGPALPGAQLMPVKQIEQEAHSAWAACEASRAEWGRDIMEW